MANLETQGEFERWSLVVVYDESTGAVVHTHQVVTARGGRHPDDAAIDAEALELARGERGETTQSLAPLRVDPRSLNTEAYYRVDLETRSLVEVPRPARG